MAELDPLERDLRALGVGLAWPATPYLRASIRPRIVVRRPWFESRWAMAAAVAIVALAALFAYSPSRDAIANWLNLHLRLQQVPVLPSPSGSAVNPSASP